jgi:AraC-like DNA-binding protein
MSDLRDYAMKQFSSEDLPENKRVELWREHFGHVFIKADIEPAKNTPFRANMTTRTLPGLQFISTMVSPVRVCRTRKFAADGNDNFVFLVNMNQTGVTRVFTPAREVELHLNDAMLMRGGDVTTYERQARIGGGFYFQIPHSTLAPLVVNIDDTAMRRIPEQNDALRLLRSYMMILLADTGLETPGLRHLVAHHIQGLIALSLGATRDAADAGVRAARLRAAKIYIIENSKHRDISIASVAAHLGVTPRYLQRIFETEGTTFSSFLLNQRLSGAHRMLSEPQFNRHAIGTLAYDAGFNDLSYFNRCFRKLYGLTPKDLRETVAKSSPHA